MRDSFNVWQRARVKGKIYTSKAGIETKSVDYFVRLKNDKIGQIEFFFGEKNTPKLFLEVFDKEFQNFHWTEVKRSGSYEICNADEIEEKLLYLKTGNIEFITAQSDIHEMCF